MCSKTTSSTIPPGVTVWLNFCSSPDRPFCLLWRQVQHLPFFTHWGPTLISLSFRDDRERPCKYISQLSRQPWTQPTWSHGLVLVVFSKLTPGWVLIHCWLFSSSSKPFTKHRGLGDFLVKLEVKKILLALSVPKSPTLFTNRLTFSLFSFLLLM